jgi:hypothetical protein
MEYQEASEEVGFKGTMTLVGCLVIWLLPLIVLALIYVPQVSYWIIASLLAIFLGLQLLRYLIPKAPRGK